LDLVLNGVTAAQVREGNRTIDVVLRAQAQDRTQLEALDAIVIGNANGDTLPLRQLVELTPGAEDALVKRHNRQYVMNVRGDTAAGIQPDAASAAIDAEIKALRASLPAGFRIETAGTVEETVKADAAIGALGAPTLLLMLALIMIQVRSFPAMWMTILTAPLGLIGAVVGLLLFGAPFGFTAILGLLGLFGILIRNTLILIEQIRESHESGMPQYRAVIEATVHRARPVVLTAIAGMLAFLPLTLTALWGPMAIVLIGGFGVGTILTLLVLPALYAAWFRVQRPVMETAQTTRNPLTPPIVN
jgi:multidrug efflux pump subunit AcrB